MREDGLDKQLDDEKQLSDLHDQLSKLRGKKKKRPLPVIPPPHSEVRKPASSPCNIPRTQRHENTKQRYLPVMSDSWTLFYTRVHIHVYFVIQGLGFFKFKLSFHSDKFYSPITPYHSPITPYHSLSLPSEKK